MFPTDEKWEYYGKFSKSLETFAAVASGSSPIVMNIFHYFLMLIEEENRLD